MVTPPQGLRREDIQIAIFCALSCEYDAVIFAFDEIWDGVELQLGNAPGDFNKYMIGRIAKRNAVLLLLSGMGKVNAASAATRLRSSYTEIKLAVLTGICGGVPGIGTDKELMLGDVVISRCIVQYDLGRRYADRFATKDTIEDGLGRPHESVRSVTAVFETISGRDNLERRTGEILQDIQRKAGDEVGTYQRPPAEDDCLFQPEYLHRHHDSRGCGCSERGACEAAVQASCDELQCHSSRLVSRSRLKKRKHQDVECDTTAPHELRVVVGRLGSGDTVMKSGLHRDRIAGKHDLVAFEMEGAGVWDRFPCVVVKAVCDYADSHKNKKYQVFAAARAASAAKAILEAFPCTEVSAQTELIENSAVFRQLESASFNIQRIDPRQIREHDKNDTELLHLLASDYEAHKDFNPKKVPGTCEWFLRDERYRKWLQSTTSNLIWVSAGPGCGKSVLAQALIEDCQLPTSSTTTTVCYFFFKDGDERRINSYDALSAILHQLFTQDQAGSLIRHADAASRNYGKELRNNFHQLWKILVDCASDPGAGKIVCVLDALDECSKQSRRDISRVLEAFYSSDQVSSTNLKFLITSRPYDDLEISFERMAAAESYIRLDGDEKSGEIRHEIDLLIDDKINELGKDFLPQHRHAISQQLKTMENRTYLWLHLTFSIIDAKRSAYRKHSSIQSLLSRLPSSIFDAYEGILSRSQDTEQARNLINIVLAASKPLTLSEVNYALTLQARAFTTNDELEEDIWPRDSFKTTAKNLCGLFLSVFDDKVFFIHQTAREFLTGQPGPPYEWRGSFNLPGAHSRMAISCIRMLSLRSIDLIMESEVHGRKPDFMAYAADNWVAHYSSQNDTTKYESSQAARQLCRTTSGQAQMWARQSMNNREHHFLHALSCTDLTLASYLGLREVVENILNTEKIDVNFEGGYFGTAVKAAAAGGHLELVQTLLRYGADCDADGGCFGTALEAAIADGHWEVIKFLRQQGDPITEEAISVAVGYNNCEKQITDLIENFGERVKITEEVIEVAARNHVGGADIIAFLLKERGDQFKITKAILEAAADNYEFGDKIIELLIEERGYEFEITEAMLKNAAGNMFCGEEIMGLLLENYGEKFSVTSTMIEIAASSRCGIATIQLLLEQRGHEFDITTQTVLNAARNKSCGVDIIRLFLDIRRDKVQVTEVITVAAAENGSMDVMKFLLDKYGKFLLTTELILTVANNMYRGAEIMTWLFETYGEELNITQDVFVAAAEASFGGSTLVVLLKWRGSDFKVTEAVVVAVVVAAARNKHGEEAMDFLLQERGSEFMITQQVVSAARGNERAGEKIMDLLHEKRAGEVQMSEGD